MTMQESFFSMDGNNGNGFASFDRMNNQNSFRPPSSSQAGQPLDTNAIASMLQQQQFQMQMNNSQSQMMPTQGNMNSSEQQTSLNISNEIKRLQQLHQMNSTGVVGNALLMQGSQRNTNDASLLQSMFEQKSPNPRFDTSLSQGMVTGGVNQMLQPGFIQDSRLFMNPMSNSSSMNPNFLQQSDLGSSHALFHRDTNRRLRGGVIEPFPEKLHRLLREVEAAGRSDVISFIAGGRAFAIHNSDSFFKDIVPLYFRQSRLSSFKRQLNLYGFELINAGPARGGYFHELFVKDRPELCRRMRRVAVKVSKQDRGDDSENPPEEARHSNDDGEPLM
ncbi:hypothetical protein FisN_6Lh234 [Fistulifera solaris]|uniref:HSF-type DNA-binding domain-containing protein n=1 Tax=Fistulifera solaris TaxID=1519565 RepID=A0A1Z5J5Y3_FISSO|nr:hypothetical protein FisN_6Lh234 [Fistulifera solaris]|eukprot:GAX09390.1 hypothetical protein FisN_6Lh234 [Fistulifera solaris]